MELTGLENRYRELFTEIANTEINFRKGKHALDRPELITKQINIVRTLSRSLDKEFNNSDEKLDAIRDIVRFDQINTEVSLEKLALKRSQKISLRAGALDAQSALDTIEMARRGSTYLHAIPHHTATVRIGLK